MRLLTFAVAAAGVAVAGAAQAASVEIKDAVARVVVIPEARSDIKVEIVSRNASLPISVRAVGDRTIVDGDLDRRIRSCNGSEGRASVQVGGVGRVAWADMPQIVIRTPKAAVVEAGGAVFGSVGRSDSLKLSNAGCGDWKVANVAGKLSFTQAGSGDARIGSAGEADVRVAGSGDVDVNRVSGPLNVDLAGSGDVDVAQVSGAVDVSIAGSGDVDIAGGKATAMNASIAGSGGVDFGGTAASLKARIAGSGDVRVKAVTGDVNKTVLGSGAVTIG
jgi:hypothetical protein